MSLRPLAGANADRATWVTNGSRLRWGSDILASTLPAMNVLIRRVTYHQEDSPMTTTAARQQSTANTQQGVVHGVLGGLAGGVVFGLMIQSLGMIGMPVGSESVAAAWVVHLAISALFGAVYGAVVAPRVSGWGPGLGAGLVYGALLWVVGPLLLMPAKLGMPLFTINTMAVQSLVGHLVFGLVLAAVVVTLSRRTSR